MLSFVFSTLFSFNKLLLIRTVGDLVFQNENNFISPYYIYAYVTFQIIVHKAVKMYKNYLYLPRDNLSRVLSIYCGARHSVGHWAALVDKT